MTAQDLKLDYFKFYDIANLDMQVDVTVRGQFDQRPQRMQLRLLDYFANPAMKNREPFYNKNAHLAWYRGVQPAEPRRSVTLENQFGRFDIRIGTGYGLLVPTQKVEEGSEFPKDLDHFKVYRLATVVEPPTVATRVRDQFGGEEVKLNYPLYFAVPVVKRFGENSYGIYNERAHLLIWSITNKEYDKTIKLKNQFTRGMSVRAVRSVMLGVPSVKLRWK